MFCQGMTLVMPQMLQINVASAAKGELHRFSCSLLRFIYDVSSLVLGCRIPAISSSEANVQRRANPTD